MPASTTPSTAAAAPPTRSLGQRTARSFLWMGTQTVGVKLINLAGQIILARFLLTKRDFGLYGLALTVAAFGSLFQQAGLNTILIQRGREFQRWANPAFWMSLAYGVAGCLFMLAAAPIAVRMYHQPPVLEGLIAILALRCLLDAFAVVPLAKLEIDLRYRAVGAVGLASNLVATGLMLLLAWLGFGAYSFIVPLPIVSAGRSAAFWLASRPPFSRKPQLALWKSLAAASGTLLLTNVLLMVTTVGSNAALGIYCTAAIVGVYTLASNFSTQMAQLFTSNLGQVLLPALSQIDQPQRQNEAFLSASRLLTLIGIPMIVLQAVVARPLVLLLFGAKWSTAVPVLQILSFGMALHIVNAPAASLLRARGQYRTLLYLAIASALTFVPAVLLGAALGGAVGVAAAVTAYMTLFGILWLAPVFRSSIAVGRAAWSLYALPLLLSVAAYLPYYAFLRRPQAGRTGQLLEIIEAVAIGTTLYLALSRVFRPALLRELVFRLRQLSGRQPAAVGMMEEIA